jgi:hypothetical protein
MILGSDVSKRVLTAGLAATALSLVSLAPATAVPGRSLAPAAGRWVSYRGYRFQVPRTWAVINLTTHPAACVEFTRHALYLGRPGASPSCPAELVGATEAVLVTPAPDGQGTSAIEDPVARRIVATAPRITVTAAYRTARPEVLAILASAGLPAPTVESPAAMSQAVLGGTAAGQGIGLDATSYTGKGFDTCTAPSAQAMAAWLAHSAYRAIGVYIGGSDRACAQPNLTAAWVRQQAAAGWHFIPLYVGPQVAFGEIRTRTAATQAVAAAQDAAVQAALLGFGKGTPIYYDMEAYPPSGSRAALKFLSAWTLELHALGYRSAVYSSSSSGIADLVSKYASTTFARPDAIDDAWWNRVPNTFDPNVPAADWADHQRVHQYVGGVTRTRGGYRITIDKDYLDVWFGGQVPAPGPGGSDPALPARQASQAVAARGGVVDAFFAGTASSLWYVRYRPGRGWSGPARLPGAASAQPSAVTTGNDRVVVFFRSTSGTLDAVTGQASGGWSAAQRLPVGRLGGPPRAVSTASGGIDVFWRGLNPSQLWGTWFLPGSGWHRPRLLASGLAAGPSPAVSGSGTVTVFWRGTDGRLWYTASTKGTWRAPAALPVGRLGSAPTAAGQGDGEISVFWGGTGRGSVWHTVWSPAGGWTRQSLVALGRRSDPVVVASSASTAQAFWKGRHGRLWHAVNRGRGGWGQAAALPLGRAGGGLFADGHSDGAIDLFWRAVGSRALWHARYRPASRSWSAPGSLGGSVG